MSDSTSSGRHINHRLPTVHRPSWVVDQNRLRALNAAVELCELPLTAAALAGTAAPGPAPPAANNTAPVAPVPGPAAHGSTTAGAQGQINPPGTGQDQTDQPNDGDDAVGEQEEEHEQGDEPGVEVDNNTVEEQSPENEQDHQSTSADNPTALVAPTSVGPDDDATIGAQGQVDSSGSGQGQIDQPIVNDELNTAEEQEQEQDNQPIGTNNHAALARVLGPTVSTSPIDAQGQTNPPGAGQDQVNLPLAYILDYSEWPFRMNDI